MFLVRLRYDEEKYAAVSCSRIALAGPPSSPVPWPVLSANAGFYAYPRVQSLAVVVHILMMVIPHVFCFLSALLSLPLFFQENVRNSLEGKCFCLRSCSVFVPDLLRVPLNEAGFSYDRIALA